MDLSTKPSILYHGTPHRGIEELEPRRNKYRDPEEGELLFATQDLGLAICFMSVYEYMQTGKFNDVTYAQIVGSREKFIEGDKGGHVYVLPSDTFSCDHGKGLGAYEWTSTQKVKPIDQIEYPSTLQAMLENGVQVYFIDQETYEKIKKSDDHGFSILKSMQSENQRTEIGVRKFY